MPAKHDERWIALTRARYLNAKRDGKRLSAADLEREFSLLGAERYPKERRIRDWMREADGLSTDQQGEYLYVRWPETFEAGLLPWEASEVMLALLRSHDHRPITIRRARWHWRVVLAAPDAPDHLQSHISWQLARYEAYSGRVPAEFARRVEGFFAIGPEVKWDIGDYLEALAALRERAPDRAPDEWAFVDSPAIPRTDEDGFVRVAAVDGIDPEAARMRARAANEEQERTGRYRFMGKDYFMEV